MNARLDKQSLKGALTMLNHVFSAINEGRRKAGEEAIHPLIVAGSAMMYHGLRDSVDDVDLQLENRYLEEVKSIVGMEDPTLVVEDPAITIFKFPFFDFCVCEGVQPGMQMEAYPELRVQTLEEILEFKKKLNREKDQSDILILEKQIGVDNVSGE